MAIQTHLPDTNGFFIGKVLKHLSYGKVKLWIPGIYDDKYKENYKVNDLWKELPDAVQISPIFGGLRKGNGMFSYPDIDSMVVCLFMNRDQNYPAYFASLLNGKKDGTWEQWDQIFPERAVEGESHTHKISIGQTYIEFHENGSISLGAWNRTESGESKIELDKDGNITIKGKKSISIEAPVINMTASQQMNITAADYVNKNSRKNTVVCDNIELNAVAGAVNIKSCLAPTGTSFC